MSPHKSFRVYMLCHVRALVAKYAATWLSVRVGIGLSNNFSSQAVTGRVSFYKTNEKGKRTLVCTFSANGLSWLLLKGRSPPADLFSCKPQILRWLQESCP